MNWKPIDFVSFWDFIQNLYRNLIKFAPEDYKPASSNVILALYDLHWLANSNQGKHRESDKNIGAYIFPIIQAIEKFHRSLIYLVSSRFPYRPNFCPLAPKKNISKRGKSSPFSFFEKQCSLGGKRRWISFFFPNALYVKNIQKCSHLNYNYLPLSTTIWWHSFPKNLTNNRLSSRSNHGIKTYIINILLLLKIF